MEVARLGEGHVVRGMTGEDRHRLVRLAESLDGEFEDGRQHAQTAVLGPPHETLLEQRPDGLEVGVAHDLGGLQGEPAGEDSEPVEQPALVR